MHWTELELEAIALMQIDHLVASVGHLCAYFSNKVYQFSGVEQIVFKDVICKDVV